MEPTYYRVNVAKISYVECWRGATSWLELVLVLFVKTFRISILATYAISNEGYQRVEWDDLFDDVRREFDKIRKDFELLGYRYCFCYRFPSLGSMAATEMVMLSHDGNSCASVKYERHQSGSVITAVVTKTIVSELSNSDVLVTCDRHDVKPAEFLQERHPRYSSVQLDQRHQERIAEVSPAYPVPFREEYDAEQRIQKSEQRIFDYYIERGILIQLTPKEVDAYKQRDIAAQSKSDEASNVLEGSGEFVELSDEDVFEAGLADVEHAEAVVGEHDSKYPAVVAELERIKNKKASWLSGALILGISIAVFLGAGAARWDWKFALLLIPILLFHEMGHFIAMRIFKYRNMKMFFIPLLGAAVTGQNYNVPGWKKVVVSLAGPVPGIFVGCAMLIVTQVMGDEGLLREAAVLTLILNAFNLLPFLPLDGGWVVHVLLFSRHHVLDIVFRSLAAGALILSGLIGMKFLMFIGIMMLLGLRTAYRVARVAADIRDANLDTSSPDGQTVPAHVVDEIVSRLDAASPLPAAPAIRAQQTLQVFESVNARPPGVAGTLALFGVYGGTLAFVFVFGIVMLAIQAGGIFPQYDITPTYVYECGTATRWPADAERLPSETATTIVATYSRSKAAEKVFEQEKSEAADGVMLTHFGQSLLVTIDADVHSVDEVSKRLTSGWAKVDVASVDEPIYLVLDATFETNEQAEAIEKLANKYFSYPSNMSLIPPWYDERELTEQEQLGRKTYQELVNFSVYDDDRYKQKTMAMKAALKLKDNAHVQKIQAEQKELIRTLQNEHATQMLEREDVHHEVIDVYLKQPVQPDWNEFLDDSEDSADAKAARDAIAAATQEWSNAVADWNREMGAHLGQVAIADGKPAPSVYGMMFSGSADPVEDKKVQFWIDCTEPADASVALVTWLCDQGCMKIKYKFDSDY